MRTDWRVLAIAGTACIYVGNIFLHYAVAEFERTRIEKTLNEDTWTDAARNPTLDGQRRRRRRDEADDEGKPDAAHTGE